MLNKYKEIIEAWKISYNPTETQLSIANDRLSICDGCEHNTEAFLGIITFNKCDACGCPISKKIFTPSFNPCPKEKWKDVDSNYDVLLKPKQNNTLI
jgi:hypothetical protein